MNGKRYDTPEYVWKLLQEAFTPAKDAAQTVAGFVSPGPRSLGAAGVAGLRSMLPGSGSWQQEFDKYNNAAGPQDSVTDRVQAPGESPFEFASRYARSPEGEREVMAAAGMTVPLARSRFLYHVTPTENLPNIAREGLRPDAPKIAEGGPHAETRAVFLGDDAAADTYRGLYGDEAATLRVPQDALRDLSPDTFSEGQSWMSRQPIQPDRLEVQNPNGAWVSLREFFRPR